MVGLGALGHPQQGVDGQPVVSGERDDGVLASAVERAVSVAQGSQRTLGLGALPGTRRRLLLVLPQAVGAEGTGKQTTNMESAS
jgi:hypothetical protein